MPTPAQIREERIMKLYNHFKDRNITTIDTILSKVHSDHPLLSERTTRDYARTVLRMIESKTKGE